jgi:aldose sugar dehydrogenase
MSLRLAAVGSAVVIAAVVAASAQQTTTTAPGAAQPAGGRGQAPAGRGQPTAPPAIQWSTPPAPTTTVAIDTAVQHMVWVVPTRGFIQPWSMAFLPDGGMLITERPGCLRLVRGGALQPAHIGGLPPIQAGGLRGLMDIALHPQFAQNQLVYFTYHKPAATTTVPALNPTGPCTPVQQVVPGANAAAPGARGGNAPDAAGNAAAQAARGGNAPAAAPPAGRGGGTPATITLARGRWDGTALADVKDIFSAVPSGNASRIVFGRDGMLYMTVGIGDPQPPYLNLASQPAQDPNSLSGKVLRLKDDGTVPGDNPFVSRAGYRPEIYTMGHRNMLGLAVHPVTGDIWESENGPNGGDEVNVLQAGKNYGWPVVSHGRFYLGPRVNPKMYEEGMEQPTIFWVPAIATSGLSFYTGDKFPNWKNNLFAGALRQGEVPRSGHLDRIDFNDQWEELHRESMLRELQQRIRDVRQGPDGFLYLLTAETDGVLLRLEPAPMPPAPAGRGGRGQ